MAQIKLKPKHALAWLLTLSMIFGILPMNVFAEEADSSVITAFEPLDELTATQYWGVGSDISELNLPDMLSATVTSGSELEFSQTEDIAVYEWQPDPAYDPETEGTYVFTPTLDLPDGYSVADGVEPPQITVEIKTLMEITPIVASDANFFTVDGADSVSNSADSGVVTAVFPATAPVTVTSVTVKSAPTNTTYVAGDRLNLAGLVVTLNKSDSTTEDVAATNFTSKGITTSPDLDANLTTEDTAITITYTADDKSVEQTITVSQPSFTLYFKDLTNAGTNYKLYYGTDESTTTLYTGQGGDDGGSWESDPVGNLKFYPSFSFSTSAPIALVMISADEYGTVLNTEGNITLESTYAGMGSAINSIGIMSKGKLSINAEEFTVNAGKSKDGGYSAGIYCSDGSTRYELVCKGTPLTVSGNTYAGTTAGPSYGIYAGNINMNMYTVNATAGKGSISHAIDTDDILDLIDAKVTAKASNEATGSGYGVMGAVKINNSNGELYATGKTYALSDTTQINKIENGSYQYKQDANYNTDLTTYEWKPEGNPAITSTSKSVALKYYSVPTGPSIAVTATGLTGLTVGTAPTAYITYTLTGGTYANPITASNFTVTGLPAGLTAGTAVRGSDTTVLVPITGTPTTYNASETTLGYSASIPAANVVSASSAITPTGTIKASAVAKKALTITGATHTKVYDNTTTATGVSGLTFSGVISGDTVSATGVTAVYTAAAAGTTTINITAATLSGAQAGNYTLTIPANGVTVVGGITKASQTLTAGALNKMVGDGGVDLNSHATRTTINSGGGAISYAVTSAGTTGATISGTTLSYTAAGTATITATAAGDTNYNSATVTFNVEVAAGPTYGITLSRTGTYTFPGAVTGYVEQTPATVSINNTGNQPTGALTIALSGTNGNSFTLSAATHADIAVGGTGSFTIKPNTGLAGGTYTATVTVSGSNNITASFDVSFTVKTAVTITADAKSKEIGASDPELTYTTTPTVSLNGALTRLVGETVGTYAILLGTLGTENPTYSITYVGANFTIGSPPPPVVGTLNVTPTAATDADLPITVTVVLGNKVIAVKTGDSGVPQTFANLNAGYYNVVADNGKYKATASVEVTDGGTADLELSLGAKQSVVEVKEPAQGAPATPDMAVGGLAELFPVGATTNNTTFTLDDKVIVDNGGTVEIKLVAEAMNEVAITTDANMIKAAATGKTIASFIDFTVMKTVIDNAGALESNTNIPVLESIITIVFPIPDEVKNDDGTVKTGLAIYRVHNNAAGPILQGSANAIDGEYFEIVGDNIVLRLKKFSTYAIGYTALTQTITASAGTGGTISPSGSVTVTTGSNQSFTITADSGYSISSVMVDGVNQGAIPTYTFSNVTASCTIAATFSPNGGGGSSGGGDSGGGTTYYNITIKKDGVGTGAVTSSRTSTYSGSMVTITVKPDTGCELDKLTITKSNGDAVSFKDNGDGTFTYTQPSSNVTVLATFIKVSTTNPVVTESAAPDIVKPDNNDVSALLNTIDHMAYVNGIGNGMFAPNANMTRAEAAQMFYNLLLDKNVAITKSFSDVSADAWYSKAVNTLASLGIISGYPDGGFHPGDKITRAQFATIVVRFAQVSTGDTRFIDVHATHWAYDYINTAANFGWVTGVGGGKFDPDRNITRAEAVTLVNRMLNREADKAHIDNRTDLIRFSDVDRSHWAYYQIMEAANTHKYGKTEDKESWE